MYDISQRGLRFIAELEGFRKSPYLCPGGYLTIGFGHLIQPKESFSVLSFNEAIDLLRKDVSIITRAFSKLIEVMLSEPQISALFSITFNIGVAAFQRSTLRQKVNREEFIEAPKEFLKWIKAGGKTLPGLIRRRKLEAELFSSNIEIIS